MIFVTGVNCDRCGIPLNVVEPLADGDLFLQLVDGHLTAKARCRNIQVCDDNLATPGNPHAVSP